MADYTEIKGALQNIYGLLDTVEEHTEKPAGLEASLRDTFKLELHMFFMYLSAADGKISSEERDYMNYLFDANLSCQDYARLIDEQNIYSTDFEGRIPLTFQMMTLFDKKMQLLAGIADRPFNPVTPTLFKFYAEAGKVFLACDGIVQNEVQELHCRTARSVQL